MNSEKNSTNERFFKELKAKIRPVMLKSVLMSLLLQLASLLPIGMMKYIIDVYIPNRDYGKLMISIIILCAVPLAVSLGNNCFQYYSAVWGRKLIAEVNQNCFDKIIHQPMKFFDANYSAEIARKCSQEANTYVVVWTVDIPQLLSNVITAGIVFLLLVQIHIGLALFQLLFLPFILLILKLTGGKLQALIEKVIAGNAAYQKQLQEAFRSIRFIKSAQLESRVMENAKQTQTDILTVWGKVAFLDNFTGGLAGKLMPGLFYGITFSLLAVLAAGSRVTVGQLTSGLGYANQIYSMFGRILSTYNNSKKAKGEMKAVSEYMGLKDEREENPAQAEWEFVRKIELQNVCFTYPGSDRQILNEVSMVFPKGKWIGLSGPSGTGKSTVLELLLRFYEADAGQIEIDGTNILDIGIAELRRHISYVSQDTYLLDGTIKDNLKAVRDGVTEEEIVRTAQLCGISEFIKEGVDKHNGEGGMLLSGGEKQRVALARCFFVQ